MEPLQFELNIGNLMAAVVADTSGEKIVRLWVPFSPSAVLFSTFHWYIQNQVPQEGGATNIRP